MSHFHAGAWLALALLLAAGDARANLIQNGDFELEVPGNDSGNGWTSSGTNVFWDGANGNPAPGFVLNESGELETDPMISQLVTGLVGGTSYRLQGDRMSYAPVVGDPEAFAFGVFLDGSLILELARGNTNETWETFSVDFLATAASHTVAFIAERNGDDSSYRIDNISLTAVPEPGVLPLLGLGLLGLLARHRRS